MALIHTAEAGYLSSTEIGKLTSLNSLNRGTLTSLVMGNVAVADFAVDEVDFVDGRDSSIQLKEPDLAGDPAR